MGAGIPAVLVAVALMALAGCRDVSRTNGTALFINSDVRGTPGGNQLRLIGREGTTTVFGPSVIPSGPGGGALTGVPTVRVLLKDAWAGHRVTVHGELLREAEVIGSGDSAPVEVVAGDEVNATIVLVPPGGGSGGVCFGCTGCCAEGACVDVSLDRCGGGGSACLRCDGSTSNACNDGTCGCGEGPDCGNGAVCLSGTCVCNKNTCPDGCCSGSRCVEGDTAAACGKDGNQCAACTHGHALCENQHCK